ncbi:hypothetical protein DENSPDRAFT_885854 [Dentipellis sp. KUC8613]|nr:hypothetical protein DENSPDRAFT_885854 [Dentipellis sp. KUC8613]
MAGGKRKHTTDNEVLDSSQTLRPEKQARVVPPEDVESETQGSGTDSGADADDSLIIIDAKHYLTSETISRMQTFMNRFDSVHDIFSISRAPHDLIWPGESDDKTTVLRRPGHESPIVFWIVGYVSSLWFFEDGNLAEQVSMTVQTANEHALTCAREVLDRFAGCEGSYDVEKTVVRAARFQTSRRRGGGGKEVKAFEEFFDARLVFQSKRKMKRLDIKYLQKGDTVLVECTTTRYKRDGRWCAGFELQSISLLAEAPDEDLQPAVVDNGFDDCI